MSENGVFYLLLEKANVPEEVTAILEKTGLKGSVAILCMYNHVDNFAEEVDGRRIDGDEVLSFFYPLSCLFRSSILVV